VTGGPATSDEGDQQGEREAAWLQQQLPEWSRKTSSVTPESGVSDI
jgi:hypothetical protein